MTLTIVSDDVDRKKATQKNLSDCLIQYIWEDKLAGEEGARMDQLTNDANKEDTFQLGYIAVIVSIIIIALSCNNEILSKHRL